MPLVKILLAEDDHDDQKLFCEFLEDRNDIYILPVVENGVELLESLELINIVTELPELIILDQNMPKLNGLNTLKELKKSDRYSHIPVMIYSTYTDVNLKYSCKEAGACAVMSKPLNKEGYHEMVDVLLKMVKEGC
jgi:CheY-like chemotaxis protein